MMHGAYKVKFINALQNRIIIYFKTCRLLHFSSEVYIHNLNTQVSFVRANSEANGTQITGPGPPPQKKRENGRC